MERPMPLTTADAVQRAALAAVLDRVADVAAGGRTPVVEIDLDLTALCPRVRTRRALAEVAVTFPVPEWTADQPGPPVLPGYTDEAWAAFVAAENLAARFPAWTWHGNKTAGSVQELFHRNYWAADRLAEDEPTPGLGEFVRRVEDRGGRVVFLSGRWLVDQIPPSRAALQRAGIADPLLLIGNARHEENVVPGETVWTDGDIKRQAQEVIQERYGVPVAVFDDRPANRQAVADANRDYLTRRGLPEVLGVAVAVPGFTHDAKAAAAALRVATFESGRPSGPDPRREPFLAARYGRGFDGPYRGLIAGLGRNGRGYVLPRVVAAAPAAAVRPSGCVPIFQKLARQRNLTTAAFMAAAIETISADAVAMLHARLNDAEAEAAAGLAEPFPTDPAERERLWHTVACAWLHSRDLEVLSAALGYALPSTGVHDLTECVPAADVIAAVVRSLEAGNEYSPWFRRWVGRLDRRGVVNVDFLNPNLTVSAWRWEAGREMPQDAMDAHRTSAHHDGDGRGRYDPVEATVNNLLHAREGVAGVQKTPVMAWADLEAAVATVAGAEGVAKSGWGGSLLRDAVPVLRGLEEAGYVMPWDAVGGG